MRGRMTAGILIALTGLVFVGQGLGVVRNQSFMVDDIRWAIIGAVMVVVGVGLVAWGRLQRR